jgi:hypothetical protein
MVRFSETLLFMSCETSLETRLAEKKFQFVLTISLIFVISYSFSTFVVYQPLHVQFCKVDTVKFCLPPNFFFVVGRDRRNRSLPWKNGSEMMEND